MLGCHSDRLYSADFAGEAPDGAGVDLSPPSPTDVPGSDPGPVDAGPPLPECDDPFAGGELLAVLPFAGEDPPEFHTKVKAGWDGRLYTDLSALEPGGEGIIPVPNFYIRTFEPDLADPDAVWSLRLDGLVEAEVDLFLEDLSPDIAPMGVHLLECSGNSRGSAFGLMSACRWSGVPLDKVLARATPLAGAGQVLISGFDGHSVPSANNHSTPGASWVFSLEQLAAAGAFLATHMNDEPLTPDHGAPARLMVPGWYGCCCIKWVDRITFVDGSAPPTSQMIEFATRTHQPSIPAQAADFLPATLDQSAAPVRVERWSVGGEERYRVIGILWGGYAPTDALQIQFGEGPWRDVEVCPPHTDNATWTVWTHSWQPEAPGTWAIRLRVDDPSVTTRRLDSGWYLREVTV